MAQNNPKGGGAGTHSATPMNNNEMFLKRALEKLLNEKEMKKSSNQALKRACETALGKLNPEQVHLISRSLISATLNKDSSNTETE